MVALFIFGLLGGVVDLLTDLMWYDALDRQSVLTTRLWAQVALFLIGFVAFALPALASIWLARRIARRSPSAGSERRAADVTAWSRSSWRARAGHGVSRALMERKLRRSVFVNGGTFGSTDPTFSRDIGFYVFDLTFWRFAQLGVATLFASSCFSLGRLCAGALVAFQPDRAGSRAPVDLGARCGADRGAGYRSPEPTVYSTSGIAGTIQPTLHRVQSQQVPSPTPSDRGGPGRAVLMATSGQDLWAIALAAGPVVVSRSGRRQRDRSAFSRRPRAVLDRPYIATHRAATRRGNGLDASRAAIHGEQALGDPDRRQPATRDNMRRWTTARCLITVGSKDPAPVIPFLDVETSTVQATAPSGVMLSGARSVLPETPAPGPARAWSNKPTAMRPVNGVTPEGQPATGPRHNHSQDAVGEPRLYLASRRVDVVWERHGEFDYTPGDQG